MSIALLPRDEERDPNFSSFIYDVDRIIETEKRPVVLTEAVKGCVRKLLCNWEIRDKRYLAMQPGYPYGSFLLYRAPRARFVVIVDTFAESQSTLIHNHRTWAVVGLIQGREREVRYAVPSGLTAPPVPISETITEPGDIVTVLEPDFHSLTTVNGNGSVSFHVYGADVGVIARLCWDSSDQVYREFQQGYSNDSASLPAYFESGYDIDSESPGTGVDV